MALTVVFSAPRLAFLCRVRWVVRVGHQQAPVKDPASQALPYMSARTDGFIEMNLKAGSRSTNSQQGMRGILIIQAAGEL